MFALELADSMSTPTLKARKRSSFADELSTAAPSPDVGPLASPWGSPVRMVSFGLPQSVEYLDECLPLRNMAKAHPSINSNETRIGSLLDIIDRMGQNAPVADVFDDLGLGHESPDSVGNHGIVPAVSVLADDTPPSTPREADESPPATPRGKTYAPFGDVPPPIRKPVEMPILMKALAQDSVVLVQEAILEDPDAARLPFWDHHVEPPLCCAVRMKCKARVVQILLQHGADSDAKDRHGNTPANILQSMRMRGLDRLYADIGEVEHLLHVRPHLTNTPPTDRTHVAQHCHWDGEGPWRSVNGLLPFA